MSIILALIGIAILIWILGNALWLLFPIIFAGAIWLLVKTFLETGAFDGVPEYMCQYTKETLRLLRDICEKKEGRNG